MPRIFWALFLFALAAQFGCVRPHAAEPDPNLAVARDFLQAMTLEDKVGQVFMVHFEGPAYEGAVREFVEQRNVGGLILYDSAGNIENPARLARLVADAQAGAVGSNLSVPLFIAVDQEGGPVSRLKDGFTRFPSQMAVAAAGSVEDAGRVARAMAAEMAAVGINFNFAPVLDVNVNPANPVINVRSFGQSPKTVAEYGTAVIRAYENSTVLSTAKHFPGHGDTVTDSHLDLPLVNATAERLAAVELPPFIAAVDAGVPAVMTAHVHVPALEPEPGLPATLSPRVLTGVLRGRLNFKGLIVTDSMAMGAIVAHYGIGEAVERAFLAGADIILIGADLIVRAHDAEASMQLQRDAMEHFYKAVREGRIPVTRLDESVLRILVAKARAGILAWQRPAPEALVPQALEERLATPAHLEIAREVSRRSITLVRDTHGFVPVKPEEPLALVYPLGAEKLARSLEAAHKDVATIPYPAAPDPAAIQAVKALAGNFGKVVVAVSNLRRFPGQRDLARELAGPGAALVALGSPYDLAGLQGYPCMLAAYGATDDGLDALARVIAGDALTAHGVLPVDVFGSGGGEGK